MKLSTREYNLCKCLQRCSSRQCTQFQCLQLADPYPNSPSRKKAVQVAMKTTFHGKKSQIRKRPTPKKNKQQRIIDPMKINTSKRYEPLRNAELQENSNNDQKINEPKTLPDLYSER